MNIETFCIENGYSLLPSHADPAGRAPTLRETVLATASVRSLLNQNPLDYARSLDTVRRAREYGIRA